MKHSVLSNEVSTVSVLATVMNRVEDKRIETKLTLTEMQSRADDLLARMGITADKIMKAQSYTKKDSDEQFIRVFMRGTTDSNEYANIYLNDNATASFSLSTRTTNQSVTEEQFVQILPLLTVKQSKSSQF